MLDKKEKAEKSKVVGGVYRIGDLYYCAKCDTVVKSGEACPNCLTEFEWDKIKISLHP